MYCTTCCGYWLCVCVRVRARKGCNAACVGLFAVVKCFSFEHSFSHLTRSLSTPRYTLAHTTYKTACHPGDLEVLTQFLSQGCTNHSSVAIFKSVCGCVRECCLAALAVTLGSLAIKTLLLDAMPTICTAGQFCCKTSLG